MIMYAVLAKLDNGSSTGVMPLAIETTYEEAEQTKIVYEQRYNKMSSFAKIKIIIHEFNTNDEISLGEMP